MAVYRELESKYTRIINTSANTNERRMAELLLERLETEYEDEIEETEDDAASSEEAGESDE